MKVSLQLSVSAIFALSLIVGIVNSQAPLQIDNDDGIFKHDHGHSSSSPEEPQIFSGNEAKIFLPKKVIPIRYDLSINPILEAPPSLPDSQFKAPGEIKILVKALESTNEIWLNQHKNLTISAFSVTNFTGQVVPATAESIPAQELYVITFAEPLAAGANYTVTITFVAPIDTHGNNNGLYLSQYINPITDQPSYLATTQFEAASARQAFPCFDEPSFKAKFQLTIRYHRKYVALTNTGRLGEEVEFPEYGPDWREQKFEETVEMSTYLVAIVVAEFTNQTAPSEHYPGKPIQIYGAPHLMSSNGEETGGVYSAQGSARILKFFEDHYGIEYHLSKMDSVAVVDFNFGAMENWGLNIYRQEYLLYWEGISTELNRKLISAVLSHELVHQWFGNLVTCEWWSYIWLNEGFATYNEYVGAQVIAPEFEYDKIQLNEVLQVALATDALPSTHPVVNGAHENNTNDQLMLYFDRITYQKGGSVIYMMDGFLGKDTLHRALKNYLNGMAFKPAQQDDLFRFITEQAHLEGKISEDVTIKDIMDTWTLQSGFPLIRVSRAGSTRIYISQERFTNAKSEPNINLDANDLWYVPLAIASADNPDFSNHTPALWLEKNVLLKAVAIDTSKWIVVNPDATGYYRVLYDAPLTNLILAELNSDFATISELSRSQLIDDYFTLATEKYIEIETALQFTKYIAAEPKIVVWNTLLKHFRVLFNKLRGNSAAMDDFRQYILPKIEGGLTTVGKEQPPGEKGWKVNLRAQLLDWACSLGQTECRNYATRLFTAWNGAPETNPVPVDIKSVVFCNAVSAGGPDAYAIVKQRYVEAKDKLAANRTDEDSRRLKSAMLSSLGCVDEPGVLAALLEDVMAPPATSFLAQSDKVPLLESLAANSQTRPFVIELLREKLRDIFAFEGVTPAQIARIMTAFGTYVGTQQEHDDIVELVEPFATEWGTSINTARTALSNIGLNIKWRSEYDQRLKEWFSANK